jgi:type VI secretion system secreted protein Hcp
MVWSRSRKKHFHGRSLTMAMDIYLVIPPSPDNPPISADPVPDKYFATTFPKGSVVAIRNFSFATENPTSIGSTSGGAGTGKARLNPVVIEKWVDGASRSLFSMNVTGQHLSKMQLYIRRAGATGGKPYLAYEFGTVFVSRIDWSGGGGELPLERVTFAYGSLALGYYPQRPDGTLGKPVEAGWDQVTNSEPKQDMLVGF